MAESKPKFDRVKFNTDPAHEQDRTAFDEMVEDSFTRITAKRKEKEPKEPDNIWDFLASKVFGGN